MAGRPADDCQRHSGAVVSSHLRAVRFGWVLPYWPYCSGLQLELSGSLSHGQKLGVRLPGWDGGEGEPMICVRDPEPLAVEAG